MQEKGKTEMRYMSKLYFFFR